MHLHRVVVLDAAVKDAADARGSGRQRRIGVAARLRRRRITCLEPTRRVRARQIFEQVSAVRLDGIRGFHQTGGMACRLEGLGNHQCDRLAAVADIGIVEGLEG